MTDGGLVRRWTPIASVFGVLLAAALIRPELAALPRPSLVPSARKSADSRPFDGAPLAKIREQAPDYVFIGNSMLLTRIDGAALQEALGGQKVFMLGFENTAAIHWYLLLKNYVLKSGVRPKAVFIFFYDSILTELRHARREDREAWSLAQEPLFGELAERDCETWRGRFDGAMSGLTQEIWPLARLQGSGYFSYFIDLMAPDRLFDGMDVYVFHEQLNARFDTAPVRTDLPRSGHSEPSATTVAAFQATLGCSYLPAMVDAARAAEVPLVFVRIQNRPEVPGQPPKQSAELLQYISLLRDYLAAQGADFRDQTGDPEITQDMYTYDNHIGRSSRIRYTELFLRRAQGWGVIR